MQGIPYGTEDFLMPIFEAIKLSGGMPYLVGGCVRDMFLRTTLKDYDIEVYGLTLSKLNEILSKFSETVNIEKDCVIKIRYLDYDLDFALPRREIKEGDGHSDFKFLPDPFMLVEEASKRRDVTINSMLFNPFTKEIVDYHGGMRDLSLRLIRHTSDRFDEDPLRVLRIMQFAGRFDFGVAEETSKRCASLFDKFGTISVERVWIEFKKLLCSKKPSNGLKFLCDCGWIYHFTEIDKLRGLQQNPEWHPEGDVFNHTCHVLDYDVSGLVTLTDEEHLVYKLACLCHDFGKAVTTIIEDGKIKSPGHEANADDLIEHFLVRIGCPQKYFEPVKTLTRTHMYIAHVSGSINSRNVKRLLVKLRKGNVSFDQWFALVYSDHMGRPPLNDIPKDLFKVKEVVSTMKLEKETIDPIIKGVDILELGFKEGPEVGRMIKLFYECQLNEEFKTRREALDLYAERKLSWQVGSII